MNAPLQADPDPALATFLQEKGGLARFDEWMAAALFDSERGYYSVNIPDVGRDGDFSTTPTLSPYLGRAIAHWIASVSREIFDGQAPTVLELGPGNGALAHSVRQALAELDASPQSFALVETSFPLRAKLKQRFVGEPPAVFETPREALAACGGHAIVYSNELVDAFPARQIIFAEGEWQEIYLALDDRGQLVERRAPLADAPDALVPPKPHEGDRIFILPSYRAWLHEQLAPLEKGAVLTIDYGGPAPCREIRGYFRQARQDGKNVFANFGKQDLTVDANFLDLRRWGEQLGWQTQSLSLQSAFFDRFLPAEERPENDAAFDYLAGDFSAGGAFYVLEQLQR